MAQYTVGHEQRLSQIESIVKASPDFIWRATAIAASDCRIASKAAKKRPSASLPDIHARRRRRYFNVIDAIGQLEWLIDFRVRIKRHEERVDEEIQRAAADRQSSNFYTLQGDRGASVRRLNPRDSLSRAFSPWISFVTSQLVSSPAPCRILMKIHQRISRCRAIAQFQPRLANTLRHYRGIFARAQAFSSATVNTYTEPGLALPLWIISSLCATRAAWGSAATAKSRSTRRTSNLHNSSPAR